VRPEVTDGHARWGTAAWVSLIVPLAAYIAWPAVWWTAIVLVLWGAAVMAFVLHLSRKKWMERSNRMLDHARITAIRTLSHHRHDWMNDLQILYGYLRLNKPDKAAEYVDRIRDRMEIDSKVCQLGHPELSLYLLAYRTMADRLRLELEFAGELNLARLPLDADRVAACLIGILNLFRIRAVSSAAENVLRMKLAATEDGLDVELAYEGEWAAGQDLVTEAAALLDGLGQLVVEESRQTAAGDASRMRLTFPLTA
jgi:sensor histidine kinase regulating citrate/malate metabolism